MSSRAEELHLRALLELYVNLSIHSAPDVRPLPMTQLPMSEQSLVGAAKPVKPISRFFGFVMQPFELPARPATQSYRQQR